MAQRLDAGERARIEVLSESGLGDGEIAEHLGRSRATIWRERRRGAPGAYRSGEIDAAAAREAVREADADSHHKIAVPLFHDLAPSDQILLETLATGWVSWGS